VEITRDGSRKVTITIADQCPIGTNPKCKAGHIDISREAFDQLGNRGNEGYLGTSNGGDVGQISWKYVPCPGEDNVFFTLKEHDNLYWNQVLVSSHRYPIEKVEVLVEGAWVTATRQEHNYWEPPDAKFGEETPYRVRVTDVNGSVLEAPVELMAGDQDSGVHFECN
jgi:expansin (peptidoglycan-binding protein)